MSVQVLVELKVGDIVYDFIPSAPDQIVHPQIIVGIINNDDSELNKEFLVVNTDTIVGTTKWPIQENRAPFFLVMPTKENGLDSLTGFDLLNTEKHHAHNMENIKVSGKLDEADMTRLLKASERADKMHFMLKSTYATKKLTESQAEKLSSDAYIAFNKAQENELVTVFDIEKEIIEQLKQKSLNRQSNNNN